jgi:hypothetical protein
MTRCHPTSFAHWINNLADELDGLNDLLGTLTADWAFLALLGICYRTIAAR